MFFRIAGTAFFGLLVIITPFWFWPWFLLVALWFWWPYWLGALVALLADGLYSFVGNGPFFTFQFLWLYLILVLITGLIRRLFFNVV